MRAWGVAWRVIAAILAFAVVVLRSISEVGWIPRNSVFEFVTLLVVGLFVLIDSIAGAVRAARRPGLEKKRQRISKAILGSLKSVQDETGVRLEVLGGSVFVPKRTRWLRRKRLARIERYRLSDYPQPSRVVWSEGKGAIGEAWRSGVESHVAWADVASRWGRGAIRSEEDFAQVPLEDRAGFDWEEFAGIVDKYAEILAVPIMSSDGSKVLGVYAIDVPLDPRDRLQTGRQLNTQAVLAVATACAALLRDVLGEK